MLTKEKLKEGFAGLGLKAGDIVLVHSSYKAFGEVDGGPQTVLDALLEILTPDGTLIMPTFNFNFNKGEPWDVNKTPSHMGILTEIARTRPDARRVFHPFYSFAILGKLKDELTRVRYKDSYGMESIFMKLRELDAKIMIIGLSYTHSMTFFHHIEQMNGVDYRYIKAFTGQVTDENGRTYEDTFTMLVRDLDKGVITEVDPMGEVLEKRGVVSIATIGEATVKLMKANDVFRITSEEMIRNPHLLYSTEKETGANGNG
jgi:aminoglycoside 3-N-acetyltransferase